MAVYQIAWHLTEAGQPFTVTVETNAQGRTTLLRWSNPGAGTAAVRFGPVDRAVPPGQGSQELSTGLARILPDADGVPTGWPAWSSSYTPPGG